MTLRISSKESGSTSRLKLDGRLTRQEVPELRRAFADAAGDVVLDLTDLQSADRQGVSVLREIRARGAQLIGVSHYLALLMGESLNGGN